METSKALFEKASKLIPGGVNSPVRAFRSIGGTPFFTKSANGSRLTTADGKELIDFVCTWGPAIHGHNPPKVREAIAEALEKGTSFGTPNPYEVEIAERVVDMVPSLEQVRFCNSGTEATMSAIRLARGATGRNLIVKFAGCYHGHVDSLLVKAGSGALTHGNPDSAGIPPAFAAETRILEYNDAEALTALFEEEGEQIAGVIVEAYPANCGLILPKPGYMQALRDICTKYGTILIFDEVMTGFRVAKGGVQEVTGITPDLTAMGKIIGGGLPVGAFGGKREIMQQLAPVGPVYQAGTLSGNPLAMAAGIAALKMLVDLDPYAKLDEMGCRMKKALLGAAVEKGLPLQVPQTGSMFAFFFAEEPVTNFTQVMESKTDTFKPLFKEAMNRGVYLPPSAYETCFISTAHSDGDLDRAIEILVDSIKAI
ncbi:MAG: glutamate-1-semialdehyde 2,1-aminomutase [Puniceicoccaceae bacterium]